MSDTSSNWPVNQHEWATLVRGFESGRLAKASWTHASHLAVASHYLLHGSAADALPILRQGIQRLNTRHGVVNSTISGYHETLTVFWVGVLAAYLRADCRDLEPLDAVRRVVREFGAATFLPQSVYTFPLLTSSQARACWVPPDVWETLL